VGVVAGDMLAGVMKHESSLKIFPVNFMKIYQVNFMAAMFMQ
jgi:hypothetical protein